MTGPEIAPYGATWRVTLPGGITRWYDQTQGREQIRNRAHEAHITADALDALDHYLGTLEELRLAHDVTPK